jgi:hypothetical protein
MLIAGATLSLAGCRNTDQAANTTNVDANLFADDMVSNDVTAIDAVTGADANMAADVNYLGELDNGTDTGGNTARTRSSPGNAAAPHKPAPKRPPPERNSAADSTANNAL